MTTSAAELDATLRPIVRRFEKFFLGRSPQETIIARCGSLIIIRSKGMITDAESRLMHADPTAAGRELVEGMFRKMVRQSQESFVGAIESALQITIRSLFCDIDPASGESLIALSCD